MSGPVAAMGNRDLDTLEIRNAWASVTIQREAFDDAPSMYYVGGEAECTTAGYNTLAEALAEAWRVLALYADGRAD